MPEIRLLPSPDAALLRDLIVGYTSPARYEVSTSETPEITSFELRLVALDPPFVKRYPPLDDDTIGRYRELATGGHAFGAFVGEECVGLALCEPQAWNATLVVHELHVAAPVRGQGIGRRLMAALVEHAHASGMRGLVCETQTTNVPAIQFYRAQGFALVGVDLAFYSNDDRERGEIAVFLRLPL